MRHRFIRLAFLLALTGLASTASAQPCSYSITPTSAEFSAGRYGFYEIATVAVHATGDLCETWFASSNDSFLTIVSGNSGVGDGTVTYKVDANIGVFQTNPRTGTLTIAGQTFTVHQDGASSVCQYLYHGDSQYGRSGGTGSVTVTGRWFNPPGCSTWTSTSEASWITITSDAGVSPVTFTVDANPTPWTRIGIMTIAGYGYKIRQLGRGAVRNDFDGDGYAELAVFRPESGTWFFCNQPALNEPGCIWSTAWGLTSDVPAPGDYDGDGRVDVAVFRSGDWYIPGQPVVSFGLAGDIPVPADYDGDGADDIAVFRPSDGLWYVRGQFVTSVGGHGGVPLPADFDGDGRADLATYHGGIWTIGHSSDNFASPMTIPWGLPGDVPVTGDVDGDHHADIAVFRPSDGCWYLLLSTRSYDRADPMIVSWGLRGDLPGALDVDGDGIDDLVVFRPSNRTWYVTISGSVLQMTQRFGWSSDVAIGVRAPLATTAASDLDADGVADLIVYRPSEGNWYVLPSSVGPRVYQWGLPGDVPVPGDYDGDHRFDCAVYRPSDGSWYVRFSSTAYGTSSTIQWGLNGDRPVPADYDGDGHTDVAVFRPATGEWFMRQSSTDNTTSTTVQWGLPGDVPMPGDYDGDGRADQAVFRPSSSEWFVRLSSGLFGGALVRQWGLTGDIPIAADFDADGRTDVAVFRPATGEWFVMHPVSGTSDVPRQWGLPGDRPIAQDFDGDRIVDLGVYRPSTGEWWIARSGGTTLYARWGLPEDTPLLRRK